MSAFTVNNFLPFHVHEAVQLLGLSPEEREREILRQRQARVERLHPGGIGYIARKLARRMDVRQGGPE